MRSHEQRFLHSTLAAYGSQLGRVAIRAAGDLVLARLILPAGHGLFDMALGVIVVAGIVRDLGLPYQLVRDERRAYGSVFLWIAGAGLTLSLALLAGAPLLAGYDPRLPAVLRFYAPFVLLDGLAVAPRVFFERELAVGRLVAPEIARGATIAAVSIALALGGWGVMGLVAGQLAGAALFAALLWTRARGQMPLALDWRPLPALIGRSGFLFLIALAALPMAYVARFVLAATLGRGSAAAVGYYGKARDWGFRLQELLLPAVARVLYPALVSYRGERDRYLGAYRIGTVTLVGLEALAAYFFYFNAEVVLLRILIGANWGPAVPLFRILCFVPLADPFSPLGGELLKAEGEDRAWFAVVMLNLGSLLAFGTLLARWQGGAGLAWANYLLAGNLLMAWRVYRICGRAVFGLLARDLAFVYLLPLPLFLTVAWLLPAAGWARFAASGAAAAVAGAGYLWRFATPFRAFFAGHPAAAPAAPPGLDPGAALPGS